MPERAACDKAIQLPQSRLKVPDTDLVQGRVETFSVQTIIGGMPRPWGLEGGFAVVYKFRTQSGKIRALRCFRVPMNQDMQFRYERIGPYFAQHAPDISAEFRYYQNGILIEENTTYNQASKTVYPLIDMEWVEGVTLLEKVDELCRRRDCAGLANLAQRWGTLLQTMHQASIAHGDFSGNNIMVRPDGRLVLVDYDGVYIPDFAGLPGIVAGQPDYQHPKMDKRPFNEHMDDFSALVIYTALLALQVQPDLWNRYALTTPQGKVQDGGILFSRHDLNAPHHSSLIQDLEQMSDTRVRLAVQELKQACNLPVEQVRFPTHIIDSDYDKKLALRTLEQALLSDNDEIIANAWIASLLDAYGPAQVHQPRIMQAKQTMQALQNFHTVLQRGKIQEIIAAYDPLLHSSKVLTKEERRHILICQHFARAYQDDSDQALNAVYYEIQSLPSGNLFQFTQEEDHRLKLAQRRLAALTKFRKALASNRILQLVSAYDEVLNTSQDVTQAERSQLQIARDFAQAYNDDNDQEIISISATIQQSSAYQKLVFTQQERDRITLAKKRQELWKKLQLALATKHLEQIADAYDPLLQQMKNISSEMRGVLQQAKEFILAYRDDDDQVLATIGEEIQQPHYQQYFLLSKAEKQRVALAIQRKSALIKFRQAIISKKAEQIVAAYDTLLAGYKHITQDEREILSLANNFTRAQKDDNDEMLATAWDDIQQSHYQKFFVITTQQEQRITLAKQRVAALAKFRAEIRRQGNQKDAQHIIASYDPILDDDKNVLAEERTLLKSAYDWIAMRQAVLTAIQLNDEQQLIATYNESLAQAFVGFTSNEKEQLKKIQKFSRLKHALDTNDDRTAIVLAQEIEFLSRKPSNDQVRINQAKRRFIRQFEAEQVEAWLQDENVIVRWRWPDDELIRYILIVWREDRWPDHPKKEVPGTGRQWFSRPRNEQITIKNFRVGQRSQILLQAFLALPDDSQAPPIWFYSQGIGPTSRYIAYRYHTHLKQG